MVSRVFMFYELVLDKCMCLCNINRMIENCEGFEEKIDGSE